MTFLEELPSAGSSSSADQHLFKALLPRRFFGCSFRFDEKFLTIVLCRVCSRTSCLARGQAFLSGIRIYGRVFRPYTGPNLRIEAVSVVIDCNVHTMHSAASGIAKASNIRSIVRNWKRLEGQ